MQAFDSFWSCDRAIAFDFDICAKGVKPLELVNEDDIPTKWSPFGHDHLLGHNVIVLITSMSSGDRRPRTRNRPNPM
jgi:hypothetical protein